ncbi:MAG: PTS lactose/cellobiose transporter subunit IIA, partial [Lachnoclostridium sp.]|nr:PTS lactose/cellobiose transporter subunit IIA [Lachnoclostridium sp.]
GDFDKAEKVLEDANTEMIKAHRTQTELIQEEIKGNHAEITLLMVHAQDHVMTALLVKELAAEMVELWKKAGEQG